MSETIRILSVKAYGSRYTGIIEDADAYQLFCLGRTGKLKIINRYERAEFRHLSHFMSVITKFIPARTFLDVPIRLNSTAPAEIRAALEQSGEGRNSPFHRSDALLSGPTV